MFDLARYHRAVLDRVGQGVEAAWKHAGRDSSGTVIGPALTFEPSVHTIVRFVRQWCKSLHLPGPQLLPPTAVREPASQPAVSDFLNNATCPSEMMDKERHRKWHPFQHPVAVENERSATVCRAFEVLGFGVNATPSGNDIRRAYFARSKECHPDKSGAHAQIFIELHMAYRAALTYSSGSMTCVDRYSRTASSVQSNQAAATQGQGPASSQNAVDWDTFDRQMWQQVLTHVLAGQRHSNEGSFHDAVSSFTAALRGLLAMEAGTTTDQGRDELMASCLLGRAQAYKHMGEAVLSRSDAERAAAIEGKAIHFEFGQESQVACEDVQAANPAS